MLKNKKALVFSLVAVAVIVVVIVIISKVNRSKKNKEIDFILDAIRSGEGEHGEDLKSILKASSPAVGFDGIHIVESIKSSKGFLGDDEDKVYKSLSGLSKSEMKQVLIQFGNKGYGDLDDYLRGFMNDGEYSKVLDIAKSAK